jgi:hypothetical protein
MFKRWAIQRKGIVTSCRSRRLAGWAISENIDTELILAAWAWL